MSVNIWYLASGATASSPLGLDTSTMQGATLGPRRLEHGVSARGEIVELDRRWSTHPPCQGTV